MQDLTPIWLAPNAGTLIMLERLAAGRRASTVVAEAVWLVTIAFGIYTAVDALFG
jgi:hypothetical protein